MSKITIYTTQTCAFCKMLKDYLDQHGFKYELKYADSDQAIAEELYEKSQNLAVPFTVIEKDDGEEVSVLGFDKPRIDSALGIS